MTSNQPQATKVTSTDPDFDDYYVVYESGTSNQLSDPMPIAFARRWVADAYYAGDERLMVLLWHSTRRAS